MMMRNMPVPTAQQVSACIQGCTYFGNYNLYTRVLNTLAYRFASQRKLTLAAFDTLATKVAQFGQCLGKADRVKHFCSATQMSVCVSAPRHSRASS
mmetsp:Transcript_70801/g.103740  ORF Transcript_70801/g.103740 Transcript_70801/m.103740 type:complete len:96 (-) Transcript_70801:48-335(-)